MAKNTATAETTPETVAPEKAPKVELRTNNGITEPRAGSKTRRVWDIANEIGAAKGEPPTIAEVKEVAASEGLNDATIQTQYNRWRKFYQLPPQGRVRKAEPETVPLPETEPAAG